MTKLHYVVLTMLICCQATERAHASQQQVRISIASSLSLVFQQPTIQSNLAAMNLDTRFAASGTIVQFIMRQAPVDVAIIAGDRFKQQLLSLEHQWLDSDRELSNPLWLITNSVTTNEQSNSQPSGLAQITRMAIPNPTIAPVGALAMAAFARNVTLCPPKVLRYELYQHKSEICHSSSTIPFTSKKSIEPRNAQAAMQYFLTGQVDAAVVTGLQVMAAVTAGMLKPGEFSAYMLCDTSMPYYVFVPSYSSLTEGQRAMVMEQVALPLASRLETFASDCPANEVSVER